jgi:hypothetical protein
VQRRAHFLARSGEAAGGVEQGGGNLDRLTSFGVSLCRHRIISTELSEKRGLARLVSVSSRLFGNGDGHLIAARWHDAAYYETT